MVPARALVVLALVGCAGSPAMETVMDVRLSLSTECAALTAEAPCVVTIRAENHGDTALPTHRAGFASGLDLALTATTSGGTVPVGGPGGVEPTDDPKSTAPLAPGEVLETIADVSPALFGLMLEAGEEVSFVAEWRPDRTLALARGRAADARVIRSEPLVLTYRR